MTRRSKDLWRLSTANHVQIRIGFKSAPARVSRPVTFALGFVARVVKAQMRYDDEVEATMVRWTNINFLPLCSCTIGNHDGVSKLTCLPDKAVRLCFGGNSLQEGYPRVLRSSFGAKGLCGAAFTFQIA